MSKELSIIIPAAGYGLRVGAPLAKEMLLHPESNEPFIKVCLDRISGLDAKKIIVTRKDKFELIEYLKNENVIIHTILPSKEWPDTVLQSELHWSQFNLLVLPDTDYYPLNAPELMLQKIHQGWDVVFATFEVDDPQRWGMVKIEENYIQIADKPKNIVFSAQAWGLILFRREVGGELFQNILQSNLSNEGLWKTLKVKSNSVKLSLFKDLTR